MEMSIMCLFYLKIPDILNKKNNFILSIKGTSVFS